MKSKPESTYRPVDEKEKKLLKELYERYGKRLYAYAIKSWKLNEDEAWEMVYKTLYRIVETHKQYQFEDENKFASFVFRVFINYLRNHFRDSKKLEERFHLIYVEDSVIQDKTEPKQEEGNDSKMLNALNDVLKDLEDWQRILLLMRSAGHPYSEIAKYISKPEEQLKVYYQRLKQEISKKINERI